MKVCYNSSENSLVHASSLNDLVNNLPTFTGKSTDKIIKYIKFNYLNTNNPNTFLIHYY